MNRTVGFIAGIVSLLPLPTPAQGWQQVATSNGARAFAIGGATGNTLYAGFSSGVVLRSDNNGLTWVSASEGLLDQFGNGLLPHGFVVGNNGRIIRVGVNGSWANKIGSPVFYSDNQGANWTEVPLPFGSPAPNPGGIAASDVVLHGGAIYFSDLLSSGVWKSVDNGLTWTSVGDQLPAVSNVGPVFKTYPAIASAGNALLTVEALRGVHRSIDGGATWSQSVSGIPGVVNSPLVGGRSWSGLDVDGAADGTAVTVVDRKVYRSLNGGSTWVEVGAGLFTAQMVELLGNKIIVVTAGASPAVYEGDSLGASWQLLPALPAGTVLSDVMGQTLSAHNGAVYIGATNGVLRLDLATAARTAILPLVTLDRTGPVLANVGGAVVANANAVGTAPFIFEWRLNGVAINGQTSAGLNWSPTAANQAGEISVVVSNGAGAVTNVLGQLTVAETGAGKPDYSFYPQALTGFPAPIIRAFAFENDGSVFFGGENLFSISGETFKGLRKAFADGRIDHTFVTGLVGGNGTGPSPGQPVRTLIPMGDGSVLVGAANTSNNDRYWRRLLADGSIDATWPWPDLMAGGPWKAVRLPDGKFLVGSGSVGGLHRLNEDGTIDSTFHPLSSIGTFQRQYVRDFTILLDGRILIAGNFSTVNGIQRRGLARLSANGGFDASFVPADIGSNKEISGLLPVAGGKLLIGGTFTTISGQSRPYLARLNEDGTLDDAFGAIALNAPVTAFAVQPDGKVWVGGSFTGVSGRDYLIRLTAEGTLDETFPNVGLNGAVGSLKYTTDGKLWIGSAATTIGISPGGQLIRIFTDVTGPTMAFAGLDRTPEAGDYITLQGAVTGPFTSVQWRKDGTTISGATSLSLPLENVNTANSGTYDLVVVSAGGSYTSAPVNVRVRGSVEIDRQPASAIGYVTSSAKFSVRAFGKLPLTYQWFKSGAAISGATSASLTLTNLNAQSEAVYTVEVTGRDGSKVTSASAQLTVGLLPGTRDTNFISGFAPGPQFTSPGVAKFLLLPNGRVFASGTMFVPPKTNEQTVLALLNADGSVDTNFTVGNLTYLECPGIGMQSNGKFVVGIRLNQGGGPHELRRLLATGEVDNTFTNSPISYPDAMIVAPDDSIYLAQGNGVDRFEANGVLDASFKSKAQFQGGGINGLALDKQGRFYVSGYFTSVGGQTRSRVVRLNADGTLDPSFTAANNLGNPDGITATSRGLLYKSQNGLVRLGETGAIDNSWQYTGQLQVFAVAPGGEIIGITSGSGATGVVLDPDGYPMSPVGGFNAPLGALGYTQLTVAADGTFYVSKGSGSFTGEKDLITRYAGVLVLETPASDPFDEWANEAGLSGPAAERSADPDGDGVPNAAEFVYGTSPTSAGERPLFDVASRVVNNVAYPTVTFLRRIGTSPRIDIAASLDFQTTIATEVVSVTPTGANMEQAIVRSTASSSTHGAQFFRLVVE